jgi:hypothetical protein
LGQLEPPPKLLHALSQPTLRRQAKAKGQTQRFWELGDQSPLHEPGIGIQTADSLLCRHQNQTQGVITAAQGQSCSTKASGDLMRFLQPSLQQTLP